MAYLDYTFLMCHLPVASEFVHSYKVPNISIDCILSQNMKKTYIKQYRTFTIQNNTFARLHYILHTHGNCIVLTDDSHLNAKPLRYLYFDGFKRHKLVQHQYHSLNPRKYNPMTRLLVNAWVAGFRLEVPSPWWISHQ